jgi:predicted Ser/Thr protein kinase
MADLVGQRIHNYEITGVLGRGGMAIVYRARQLNIQREVAIKVIKPDLAESDDLIKRFEREANTVAQLSHPHILKLFDYGEYEEVLYLVMELLPGGTLADVIRENPLSPERAAQLLDQIADALDYAHAQGLIHRDLKPQNILLDKQGNALLTDFGIAKVLSQSTHFTQTGAAIGTPAYMPPEQWQGRPVTHQADVYALGVMLYEILTGKLPFTADTPAKYMYRHLQDKPPSIHSVVSGLPPGVDRVIQTALAKKPEDRFGSAGEMARAFRQAIEGEAVPAEPEAAAETATFVGGVDEGQTNQAKARVALPTPAIIAGALIVLLGGGLLLARLLSGTSFATPTVAPTGVAAQPTIHVMVALPSKTDSPAPISAPSLTSTLLPTRLPTRMLAPVLSTLTSVPPAPTRTLTATATVTPTLTLTLVPPTLTPTPTINATVAARSTHAVEATINAVRTQVFFDDQTAEAARWTATFTPSPTPTITFTPSATYTATPVPTPTLPVWDDFRSASDEATLWEIQSQGTTTAKIIKDGLRFETDGGQSRWVRSTRFRAIAALVTLETEGSGFDLAVIGTDSTNTTEGLMLGFDCAYSGANLAHGGLFMWGPYRPSGLTTLRSPGCPQTHLVLISLDGKLAHFFIDGEEKFAPWVMVGDAAQAGMQVGIESTAKTHAVIIVHKVWVKSAYQ